MRTSDEHCININDYCAILPQHEDWQRKKFYRRGCFLINNLHKKTFKLIYLTLKLTLTHNHNGWLDKLDCSSCANFYQHSMDMLHHVPMLWHFEVQRCRFSIVFQCRRFHTYICFYSYQPCFLTHVTLRHFIHTLAPNFRRVNCFIFRTISIELF